MDETEKREILEEVCEREWEALRMATTLASPNAQIIRAALSNIITIGRMLKGLAAKTSGWISVKERLPEANRVVLVYADNVTTNDGDYAGTGLYSANLRGWALPSKMDLYQSAETLGYKVTRWAPWPEAAHDREE